jgi:hypothetical protein
VGLMERTLAAVQSDRMTLHPQEGEGRNWEPAMRRARWRRRIGAVGAMVVAASLLLVVTLVMLGQARNANARAACKATLNTVEIGFSDYAADAGNELPYLPVPENKNWLHGNTPLAATSNTANLIPLVDHNYVPLTAFYCPAVALKPPPPSAPLINEMPPISYSYRVLYGPELPSWDRKHETIIMADRNPLFAAGTGGTAPSEEQRNSPNHAGEHGMYVMRADGSVTWEVSPNIGPGGDNIWTISSGKDRVLSYRGDEVPVSTADEMLAP